MLIDKNEKIYKNAEEWLRTFTPSEFPWLLSKFESRGGKYAKGAIEKFAEGITMYGITPATIDFLLKFVRFVNHSPEIWKLRSIPEGDTVKIIDAGKLYPTYKDFFFENDLSSSWLNKWKEGYVTHGDGDRFTVLYIGSHILRQETKIAVIESVKDKSIYLIDIRGVEKIKDEEDI